jgi:hypothetical protein
MAKLLGGTTVYGLLSTTGIVYASGGNSNQWNTSYVTSTAYSSVSSTFATNTTVNTLTGSLLATTIYQNASGSFITAVSGTAGQINASKTGSTVTLSFSSNAVFPGNVTILGNLSAQGTATFANTIFTTTSALCAIANSSGPALYIGQQGSGDLASFYDLSPTPVEVLHIGASVGIPGVGIYTSNPNKELTVVGEISATKTIYASGGNSNQWNNVYSLVSTTTATTFNVNNLTTTGRVGVKQTPLYFDTDTANIGNSYGTFGIGAFNDISITPNNNLILSPAVGYNVGVNTSAPNQKLTVSGNISSSNIIYDATGNSNNWNSVYTSYNTTSSSFATNTLLQSTSALLTPLTLTNTLTSLLVTNTAFTNYQTSVANTTATLLPTSVYQNASGSFVPNTAINSLTGNWNTAYRSVSSQPYTLVDATSSINTISGSNIASGNNSNVVGGYSNTASGYISNVAGGRSNTASGSHSNVGGGVYNTASGYISNVAGGRSNTASGQYSNVGGGVYNTASNGGSNVAGGFGNTASGQYSNVAGGFNNKASIDYSNVAGGINNTASGYFSNVAGGGGNIIIVGGNNSSIGGGDRNCIQSSGWWSGVGNGCGNFMNGNSSFIGSGTHNIVTGYSSIVGSGSNNSVSVAADSLVNYWTLNESSGTRYSSVGNSNPLIQHGTVNSTTGIINNGIIGNGSGWLTTTNPVISAEFTINYWTIPNTNGSIQQFSGPIGASLNFNVKNSNIYYGIPGVSIKLNYNPPGGIPTNTWSMATLTRNKDNVIRMYYNGVLVGIKFDSTNYTNTYGVFSLPNGSYAFASNGAKMDELGIWSRALSLGEIKGLYNNSKGSTYPFSANGQTGAYSVIAGGINNYIGSDRSFIAAGQNNVIVTGTDNSFILGSNITALSANYTYTNSLELTDTPSILILKDSTGKRWKVGVNTSGTPVGLGAA